MSDCAWPVSPCELCHTTTTSPSVVEAARWKVFQPPALILCGSPHEPPASIRPQRSHDVPFRWLQKTHRRPRPSEAADALQTSEGPGVTSCASSHAPSRWIRTMTLSPWSLYATQTTAGTPSWTWVTVGSSSSYSSVESFSTVGVRPMTARPSR